MAHFRSIDLLQLLHLLQEDKTDDKTYQVRLSFI
jgi:hypothetical protein